VTHKHLITRVSVERTFSFGRRRERKKVLNHDWEAAWTSKARIQSDYPRSMSMNHLTWIPAPKDTRSPIRDELRVQISRYIGAPGFLHTRLSLTRGANRTNCNYCVSYKYGNNVRCLMSHRLPIKRYNRYIYNINARRTRICADCSRTVISFFSPQL